MLFVFAGAICLPDSLRYDHPQMADHSLSLDDPLVRRRLEAARGYCDLGLPHLASQEIAPLREPLGHLTEIIELELMILLQEKRWSEGLAKAQKLIQELPSHPAGWLQSAFCLHESGRTREALECLINAPRPLRKEALYHYNCGCYFAVLGQMRDAITALKRAFEIDPEYKKNAKSDPDLVSVREQL
ncbi:MAG: TPR end-of-group domain-containing protein [Verrucomicrobiales bacterium]